MKVGDLILYTPGEVDNDKPDMGIVLKLSPNGTKASVLWSTESVGSFLWPITVGDLERYPDAFKLVVK